MQVTKTVRDYIKKKVAEKVIIKYEAEKLEAKRQEDLITNFLKNLEKELETIAIERINTFLEANSFVERGYQEKVIMLYSSPIKIANNDKISSVHGWYIRAKAELKDKVNNIVVALEQGGSKEDLDRMLSEL